MNFERLASNLQEEEKKLESQILPYCDPQQIANELMSQLEKAHPLERTQEISEGHYVEIGSLVTSYELWGMSKISKGDIGSWHGPLANCSDRDKLAQVILNSVKKYITDDIIKLSLEGADMEYASFMGIYATISRADVEKIKRMNPR